MKPTTVSLVFDRNPKYLGFAPYAKYHYERNLGMSVHFTYVGSTSDVGFQEIFPKLGRNVTVLPRVEGEAAWHITWALFYAAKFIDPDETIVVMGIDQFPKGNILFQMPKVVNTPDDHYIALVHSSPDWRDRESDFPDSSHALPRSNLFSAYHMAKASTFREVYQFSESWEEEIRKISAMRLWYYKETARKNNHGEKWGYDESYSTIKLREWDKKTDKVRTYMHVKRYRARMRSHYEWHFRKGKTWRSASRMLGVVL